MKQSTIEECDAVDLITDCMYSIDFLFGITNNIFSNQRDRITIGQYYEQWFKETKSERKGIIPFNPGIFLGYLYVGILYAKENWFELLPEENITHSDEVWGLRTAKVFALKEQNPTVKYVIRRIRNSLGHGRPHIKIPPETTRNELLSIITFTFYDENPKDKTDNFEITLTLEQLTKLIKKFQSVIHTSVRQKKV